MPLNSFENYGFAKNVSKCVEKGSRHDFLYNLIS